MVRIRDFVIWRIRVGLYCCDSIRIKALRQATDLWVYFYNKPIRRKKVFILILFLGVTGMLLIFVYLIWIVHHHHITFIRGVFYNVFVLMFRGVMLLFQIDDLIQHVCVTEVRLKVQSYHRSGLTKLIVLSGSLRLHHVIIHQVGLRSRLFSRFWRIQHVCVTEVRLKVQSYHRSGLTKLIVLSGSLRLHHVIIHQVGLLYYVASKRYCYLKSLILHSLCGYLCPHYSDIPDVGYTSQIAILFHELARLWGQLAIQRTFVQNDLHAWRMLCFKRTQLGVLLASEIKVVSNGLLSVHYLWRVLFLVFKILINKALEFVTYMRFSNSEISKNGKFRN